MAFPGSDERFPAVIPLFVAVNFLFNLPDYKTAINARRFPAKPLQSQTALGAFITFAADSLGAGIRDAATFPVSHSGASHWSEELQELSSFSQPLHVLGDLLGGEIGGGLCLFSFFPLFFFLLSLETGTEIFFSPYVKARCCMEAPLLLPLL